MDKITTGMYVLRFHGLTRNILIKYGVLGHYVRTPSKVYNGHSLIWGEF